MSAKEIVGVVFPIPPKFLSRFFEDGKTVFVKYPKLINIRPGMKLLFYSSHITRAIVGEATIEEFEIINRDEVLKKYKERLFLTPEEFKEYSAPGGRLKRKSNKFIVCILNQIKRYKTVVRLKRIMNPTGHYLTKDNYEIIRSKSKGTM